MTPLEFATAVYEAFVAKGWSTAALTTGSLPTAHLDSWTRQVSEGCTSARAEALVCRLTRDHGVNPEHVRFTVERGHVLVQLRTDLEDDSLASRSTWNRLKK